MYRAIRDGHSAAGGLVFVSLLLRTRSVPVKKGLSAVTSGFAFDELCGARPQI